MLIEGDNIPELSGLDQNGNEITLKNKNGKKTILFFYPKDSTPGCTMEACNLRDNYEDLLSKGFDIIGVSADSQKRHQNFIAKNSLPFPLIADEEKEIINAFGVWGPKKFMGREFDGIHRTTFVYNEQGEIERVFKKVKTKDHASQILETY